MLLTGGDSDNDDDHDDGDDNDDDLADDEDNDEDDGQDDDDIFKQILTRPGMTTRQETTAIIKMAPMTTSATTTISG